MVSLDRERTMLKTTIIIPVIILLVAAAPHARAQSGDKTAPVTSRPDRTTADPATRKQMQEKRAALRVKRNACIKEFKAAKISLLKRNTFINACMAKA
jgi:hypothetical protein